MLPTTFLNNNIWGISSFFPCPTLPDNHNTNFILFRIFVGQGNKCLAYKASITVSLLRPTLEKMMMKLSIKVHEEAGAVA